MVSKLQISSALCLVVLVTVTVGQNSDQIPDPGICVGVNADTRCSLSCLMYSKYVEGYCEDGFCHCQGRKPVPPSADPVPYGRCASVDGDGKCNLTCLFFQKFKEGFCQDGVCMCSPK
ncbi:uncharacterized protein LOC119649359 [Hermetia illucens]|nr:uncharacterized protein LOC119649359 [Hermetia illucens]